MIVGRDSEVEHHVLQIALTLENGGPALYENYPVPPLSAEGLPLNRHRTNKPDTEADGDVCIAPKTALAG